MSGKLKESDSFPSKFSQEQWEPLEQLIAKLVGNQRPNRLKILTDIFKVCVKLAKESPGTLNLKITSTVLKELRFSFKMFYPHRFVPKITMFGSARVPSDSMLYSFAREFATLAVGRGYHIITGGGPGIMSAGNEGAQSRGSFGLNIRLPMEQTANPFLDSESTLIHYKYFFIRKLFLVKEAKAFALFPGGFGTFDEMFEVLTLLQTGKSNLIPVVLLEPKGFGFWEKFEEFIEKGPVAYQFIDNIDRNLYRILHSPEEALDHIDHFYRIFHSMRQVNGQLVFRLRSRPSNETVQAINQRYSDLSGGTPFSLSFPLPEEENEPELKDLTRLVFSFKKHNYGMMRELIDFINGAEV